MEGMFGKHPRFTSMPTLHGGATVLQSRIRRGVPREYLSPRFLESQLHSLDPINGPNCPTIYLSAKAVR
jgi:hypothetical protein